MNRAKALSELALETELEWRLHEQLGVCGVKFKIKAGEIRVEDPENPAGRAWFCGDGWRARHVGASGFELEADDVEDARPLAHPTDVANAVQAWVTRKKSP